jgi:hypothetical protein
MRRTLTVVEADGASSLGKTFVLPVFGIVDKVGEVLGKPVFNAVFQFLNLFISVDTDTAFGTLGPVDVKFAPDLSVDNFNYCYFGQGAPPCKE